jgi:hypothetical protein
VWQLDLPQGKYRAEWIDVLFGKGSYSRDVKQTGEAPAELQNPLDSREVAVRVKRVE